MHSEGIGEVEVGLDKREAVEGEVGWRAARDENGVVGKEGWQARACAEELELREGEALRDDVVEERGRVLRERGDGSIFTGRDEEGGRDREGRGVNGREDGGPVAKVAGAK